jgi:hypothetical protein
MMEARYARLDYHILYLFLAVLLLNDYHAIKMMHLQYNCKTELMMAAFDPILIAARIII